MIAPDLSAVLGADFPINEPVAEIIDEINAKGSDKSPRDLMVITVLTLMESKNTADKVQGVKLAMALSKSDSRAAPPNGSSVDRADSASATTLLTDPLKYAADVRLITKSAKDDWPIEPDVKALVAVRLSDIVRTATGRLAVNAAKALIAMNAQNQKANPVTRRVKHTHKIVPLDQLPPVTEQNLEERRQLLLGRFRRVAASQEKASDEQ